MLCKAAPLAFTWKLSSTRGSGGGSVSGCGVIAAAVVPPAADEPKRRGRGDVVDDEAAVVAAVGGSCGFLAPAGAVRPKESRTSYIWK